ncbi:MAG: Gldg family protein, partial [Isosphaeraceae bacterium]
MTTLQKEPAGAARASRTAAGPLRPHVVDAVFHRNFLGYFSNPAGYVFITLFVAVGSLAAFFQPDFFARNLANLDELNRAMPYLLLFFIPAITMSAWAEERRQGTDELLLTLPARDVEVVLGKYLAALGIYTVALVFLAVGHVAVLKFLGKPDIGVLFATYLGYWLMGGMLIAVGLVASMLSTNVTVAFILGGVFAAIPILLPLIAPILAAPAGLVSHSAAEPTRRLIESLSVPAQFRDFGAGVIPLAGIVYFLSLTVGLLYVNMVLLGRRHWAGGEGSRHHWVHATIRTVALAVSLTSLVVLVGARLNTRLDASQAKLSTLSPESKALVRQIPTDRPVYIQAYYSPEVPREYVQTKTDLLNLLREYASIGGSRVHLNLVETQRYSPEARDAEKQFGITPRRVLSTDEARQSAEEIFLGVAFTSGPEEVVVPFFDRGLPVEYELTRSIRVVSRGQRKKVGIIDTDAKLLGGFDAQSMSQNNEWQIV